MEGEHHAHPPGFVPEIGHGQPGRGLAGRPCGYPEPVATKLATAPDAGRPEDGPPPQPERRERRLVDPGLLDLSRRDSVAILKRAGREALDDQITDRAAALAYYAFLAVPACLLLAVGVFGLLAEPSTVTALVDRLRGVVPAQAAELVESSLGRIVASGGGNVVLVSAGAALALWTATGAMGVLMRALNAVHEVEESRGFIRQRAVALAMLALALLAVVLVVALLVLGPHLSGWLGEAVGLESVLGWIWWTAQWPILLAGLFLAFAGLLALGPDVEHRRLSFVTPGSLLAVVVWLVASGLFSLYVAHFGSYDKTWGALGAVVVTLTWLWLSGLALLLGAEVNAEALRSRDLRERGRSTSR